MSVVPDQRSAHAGRPVLPVEFLLKLTESQKARLVAVAERNVEPMSAVIRRGLERELRMQEGQK